MARSSSRSVSRGRSRDKRPRVGESRSGSGLRSRSGTRPPVRRSRRSTVRRRKRSKKLLNKRVKKIVKNEMMCQENVGIYTKHYTGEIEPSVAAGQYNYAFAATRNQGNSGAYSVFNMLFKPFSRKKILDAASVLYGGKTKGLAIDGTGNFNLAGVKIDTIYCSYDIRITNYTQFPYEVELWSVTNKENTDRLPLDTMSRMLPADEYVGGVPTFELAAGNQYRADMCLDLSTIKGLSAKYKLEKVKSGVLFPGIGMKHFVKQGMRCYDMTKDLFVTEGDPPTSVLPSHGKGEVSYFLKYTPVMHIYASAANYVATNFANTGNSTYGFLVEVKEVFKLFEPAETPETQVGDKRCCFTDVPSVPAGTPATTRFINTGPTFTDVTNPVI